MQVKVFSAEKLHKALALVRGEFGPDAVIMDRLEGVDDEGNRIWHVHAALDYEDENEKKVESQPQASKTLYPDSSELFKASMERLERIVEGLGHRESSTLRDAVKNHDSKLAFDHLVQLGVAPTHAFDMADDFAQRNPINASVLHWAERIAPEKRAATVLLAGPSGAGKTTLIAKLATHYSLKGVRVAVLSTDVNRMGATDILKSYSEILGLPFFTARTEADVAQALDATESAQLLLVDSEGWNIRRGSGVRKQRILWDAIPLTHRILVMPANMDEVDGMELLAKAEALGVKQLAFTKLDETSRPGKVVNWAAAFGMKLSYCSFGPEVPDQMGWLTPKALTTLLAGQKIEFTKERA